MAWTSASPSRSPTTPSTLSSTAIADRAGPVPGVARRRSDHPIITLTTDFGLRDPYVAQMKAVILGVAPGATIVDLTHELAPHDIVEAALALDASAGFFP